MTSPPLFDSSRAGSLRCPSRRYQRHGMLPQLAAFEAVVRLGSVARAAEALCLAQPTLSGHLRKLSEALGVRLFALQGKRMVPTEAALPLLQAARDVHAAFARCEADLAVLRAQLAQGAEPGEPAGASFSPRVAGATPAHAGQPHTPHAAAPAP